MLFFCRSKRIKFYRICFYLSCFLLTFNYLFLAFFMLHWINSRTGLKTSNFEVQFIRRLIIRAYSCASEMILPLLFRSFDFDQVVMLIALQRSF